LDDFWYPNLFLALKELTARFVVGTLFYDLCSSKSGVPCSIYYYLTAFAIRISGESHETSRDLDPKLMGEQSAETDAGVFIVAAY
jgi:hypothetical protein